MNEKLREDAGEIFLAAVKSVDPYKLVRDRAGRFISEIDRARYRCLHLLSIGKAAFPMAKAACEAAGDFLAGGIVLTKYDHAGKDLLPGSVQIFEAGHPVPDDSGVKATEEIIRMIARDRDSETILLCLLSGGGSSLLVSPYGDLTLEEKQTVTRTLLEAGADIRELNTVRKHLSGIKGGRLAQQAFPAKIVSFILSDVIGDPLDVIASGPTAPDGSTYRDAVAVIDGYSLRQSIPPKAIDILLRGARGDIPETPKAGDPVFRNVENMIIGNNKTAIEAARVKAGDLGYEVSLLAHDLQGEARVVGARLAVEALKARGNAGRKRCLIAGGETTVKVRGSGRGGRNMELALAFAREIRGHTGITLLSAGTDGTDGPTDAAGAIVNGETIPRAAGMGLNAEDYLERNDTYSFFRKTGELLVTGPTGTNVMDMQIVLL